MFPYPVAYTTVFYRARDLPEEKEKGWENQINDTTSLEVNDSENPLRVNDFEAEQLTPGCAQKLKYIFSKVKRGTISLIAKVRTRLHHRNDNVRHTFIGNEQPIEEDIISNDDNNIMHGPEECLIPNRSEE